MWSTIWHGLFFDPIYNLLVLCIDTVPGGDVGLAVICATVLVKVLLLPLSIKAAKTQKVIREIEPKMKEIKEKITDGQEQARAILKLYTENGINPFASILLMFVQIPILIALYLSVYSGGGVAIPGINTELLYSFIPAPETVSMFFLGLFDVTQKSLVLAVLAGVFQFAHGYFAFPPLPARTENEKPSMKEEFTRSLQVQMKYVMPVIITVVAYSISAVIALYFVVSSITALLQELLIRKHKA